MRAGSPETTGMRSCGEGPCWGTCTTVSNELAHLRHLDHSERFKRLYWKILNEARELGYYQPGPGGTPAQQLDLFADGACGMDRHAR